MEKYLLIIQNINNSLQRTNKQNLQQQTKANKSNEPLTRGFVQVGLDGISFNFCATIYLQFQQDVINLANEQNICNIAIINSSCGQTVFYFPTCTKP